MKLLRNRSGRRGELVCRTVGAGVLGGLAFWFALRSFRSGGLWGFGIGAGAIVFVPALGPVLGSLLYQWMAAKGIEFGRNPVRKSDLTSLGVLLGLPLFILGAAGICSALISTPANFSLFAIGSVFAIGGTVAFLPRWRSRWLSVCDLLVFGVNAGLFAHVQAPALLFASIAGLGAAVWILAYLGHANRTPSVRSGSAPAHP